MYTVTNLVTRLRLWLGRGGCGSGRVDGSRSRRELDCFPRIGPRVSMMEGRTVPQNSDSIHFSGRAEGQPLSDNCILSPIYTRVIVYCHPFCAASFLMPSIRVTREHLWTAIDEVEALVDSIDGKLGAVWEWKTVTVYIFGTDGSAGFAANCILSPFSSPMRLSVSDADFG